MSVSDAWRVERISCPYASRAAPPERLRPRPRRRAGSRRRLQPRRARSGRVPDDAQPAQRTADCAAAASHVEHAAPAARGSAASGGPRRGPEGQPERGGRQTGAARRRAHRRAARAPLHRRPARRLRALRLRPRMPPLILCTSSRAQLYTGTC